MVQNQHEHHVQTALAKKGFRFRSAFSRSAGTRTPSSGICTCLEKTACGSLRRSRRSRQTGRIPHPARSIKSTPGKAPSAEACKFGSRKDKLFISMYNTYVHDTYRRIIIVIDELAEILDKKRFPKAQHARIDNIIGYLSIIACTGRVFGVHLILGTQRPDAAVVPGQIKDNISFKCCGRAENVLSQIILDDARASELIPADAQGLFVCNDPDKTVFRAYYLDNKQLR